MSPRSALLKWLHLVRQVRLRSAGASLEGPARLGAGVRARPGMQDGHRGRIRLGADCCCEEGVILDAFGGSIEVGPSVFLGPYVVIYGHGGVSIGANTLVAMHCSILSSNHTISPIGVEIRSQPDVLRPTKIGRDVWLGARVTVLGGVTIGDGCIVGAGALVTKDLPPGAIAFGSPCTVRKFRPGAP